MPLHRFRGDVELLREGIALIEEFGLSAAERLASVAEFLEHSVYEAHSLREVPGGVTFALLNPPLRVGGFSAVRVRWDGVAVPPDRAFVRREGEAVERRSDEVSATHLLDLAPGRRIDFRLEGTPVAPGHHRVRVELQNVAIPPLVWFEFADAVAPARRAP